MEAERAASVRVLELVRRGPASGSVSAVITNDSSHLWLSSTVGRPLGCHRLKPSWPRSARSAGASRRSWRYGSHHTIRCIVRRELTTFYGRCALEHSPSPLQETRESLAEYERRLAEARSQVEATMARHERELAEAAEAAQVRVGGARSRWSAARAHPVQRRLRSCRH